MWFLFHQSTKTKAVAGGETFSQVCPSCDREATFTEVELTENAGVFFVDVIGDQARAFRCCACGDTFDIKREDEVAEAPHKSTAELAAEAKLLEQRRLAEQARREIATEQKAIRIDDELAALKKKMGR